MGLNFLADRPKADAFAPYLEGREPLLVNAIEIYEVYKVIRRDVSEEAAIEAVAAFDRAELVPVDQSLALEAADVALEHGLAMADAIIYVTATRYGATVVTADADFAGLPGTLVV